MALGDPNDPLGLQADPLGLGADPFLDAPPWPPPEWSIGATGAPVPNIFGDLGPGTPVPKPPPPPPPPPQRGAQGPDIAPPVELAAPPPLEVTAPSVVAPPIDEPPPDPFAGAPWIQHAADLNQQDQSIDTEAARIAGLAPEDYVVEQDRYARQREDERARRLQPEADARLQAERDATEIHLRATVASGKDLRNIQALSENIKPELSTGQTIAAMIGAAIGGFLHPGGPNMTIDAMNTAIERSIKLQRDNLNSRKNGIAELMAQGQSEFDAAAAVRLAHWNEVVGRVDADMQNYDPMGATAHRYAELRRDAHAQVVLAQQAYEKQKFEEHKVDEGFKVDRERLAESERASKRSTGLGYAGIKQQDRELAYKKENDAANRQSTLEAATGKAELDRLTKQSDAVQTRGINDANGNLLLQPEGTAMMQQADQLDALALSDPENAATYKEQASQLRGRAQLEHGLVVRDAETAKDISAQLSATDTLTQYLDEIDRIRGENIDLTSAAGIGKFADSDRYQALKSLQAQATVAYGKANKLGTLDEGLRAVTSDIFGDPISLISNAKALETARRGVTSATRNQIKRAGYRGEYDVPNASDDPAAQADASQKAVQSVRAARTPEEQQVDDQPGFITRAGGRLLNLGEETPREKRPDAVREGAASRTSPGVTGEQESSLRKLASTGSEADRNRLIDLAKSDRAGIAQGAINALADAGDYETVGRIGAEVPADSVAGREAARAYGTAVAVHLDQLGEKARGGDVKARQKLYDLAKQSTGEVQQMALDALTGAKVKPSAAPLKATVKGGP